MSDYTHYRDAAAGILSRQSGQAAVDAFGLADVFAEDRSDLVAAYAFLEAQGRHAASTPALSLLALAQYPEGVAPAGAAFGLAYGRGLLVGVPADGITGGVVADLPGRGLVLLDEAVEVRQHDLPDDYLVLVDTSSAGHQVLLAEPEALPYRPGAVTALRLGIAAELLGVCTRLLDDAIAYAKTRQQFGQPIGDFQSVQHLLAWSATDLHQLRCLFDVAVQQQTPSTELAQSVKALAGRTLHSVAQTAIQVTGAISFTWEYSLNRLHHRGLALDQLVGPSADLVAEIGRGVRTTGTLPALFELSDVSG